MRKSLSISLMISMCASAAAAPALSQGMVGAPVCPWIGGLTPPDPLMGIGVNECRGLAVVIVFLSVMVTIFAHRRKAMDSLTASFIISTLVGSVPTGWAIAVLSYPNDTANCLAGYQGWSITTGEFVRWSVSALTTTFLISSGIFGFFGALVGGIFQARSHAWQTQILGCLDRRKNVSTSRLLMRQKKQSNVSKVGHVMIALVIVWNWCGWRTNHPVSPDPNHGGAWTESSFLLKVMYHWDDPTALFHDGFG